MIIRMYQTDCAFKSGWPSYSGRLPRRCYWKLNVMMISVTPSQEPALNKGIAPNRPHSFNFSLDAPLVPVF